MSESSGMGDPSPAGSAANRHRPDASASRGITRDDSAASAAHGRGALIALGVAAIGTVAFVVGLRTALRHLPPERPAGAVVDSARAPRFKSPEPTPGDEYPRLR